MGNGQDNNQQTPKQISSNTQVIFTIKSFLATIGTILGLFVGFYTLVIVPSQSKSEEYQEKLILQQQKYIGEEFEEMKGSIEDNTNAITLNTDAIKANNDRFRDLNTTVENINTSGSLGQTNVTKTYIPDTIFTSTINDSTLFANYD